MSIRAVHVDPGRDRRRGARRHDHRSVPAATSKAAAPPARNALTITKSLTIKGAGADLVSVKPVAGAQIIEAAQDIRNGVGDIVSVVGDKALPITVDISGVSIDGNGAFVEAGVVYLDAKGTFFRNRVTNVVTSELAADSDKPGGYRGPQFGYGVAQVTANTTAPAITATRTLTVTQSRIDRYNRIGVLIDGATNDRAPFERSGVTNRGVISNNSIVGRLLCTNFGADGNCTASGSPGQQPDHDRPAVRPGRRPGDGRRERRADRQHDQPEPRRRRRRRRSATRRPTTRTCRSARACA